MFVTYVLTDDNGIPFYVGAGNEQRPGRHLAGTGGRPAVNTIIDEHRARGSDIGVVVVKTHATEQDAFNHEKYLISIYGKRSDGGLLVNICDGGRGVTGYRATEESKQANSERNTRRFSDINERLKISIATKRAMENPELRRKISDALTAKWTDNAYRNKLVESHTGRTDSDQTKERKSEAQRDAWANGRRIGKYTDEQILEIYSMKGTVNVNEVAKMYGMNPTYVHKIWRHERCVSNLKRLGIISKETDL